MTFLLTMTPWCMHRRTVLVATVGIGCEAMLKSTFVSANQAARPVGAVVVPWRELWNGRDLGGWETWLGRPHPSVPDLALDRDSLGQYVGPVGVGKDPRGVYTVVRLGGERLLRISGEVFGAITSTQEFSDFHLRVEWRWGHLRWPPRQVERRDSGLLYHCIGEHGASGPNRNWMRSLECQIQERDCGDLWVLGGTVADSRARLGRDAAHGDTPAWLYDPKGIPVTVPEPATGSTVSSKATSIIEPRVRRSVDHERPAGEWNIMEVFVQGDEAEHQVNGKTVLHLTRARWAGKPLTQGKLQIQSEGAEIYFRRIALRGLAVRRR